MRLGRPVRALLGGLVLGAVIASASASAATGPAAHLTSEQQLSAAFSQGIARVPGGWILTGTTLIARVDQRLRTKKLVQFAIPSAWRAKGYNHIGDGDVVGRYLYVPYEEPDYTLGHQATARYDAKTLRFVDAIELPQHQNSFVTIDPRTMIAYTMDEFSGTSLLRYDVRHHWKPLTPLVMSANLDNTQGADVAAGAVWISTSNPTNELYRVDVKTGHVDDLGSAGHLGGEGEGMDATRLRSGRIHTLTVDPKIAPVWLGSFAVEGERRETVRS